MSVLSDPSGGVGYLYGAPLPSAHMTTIATQQPRAVDGGVPVGSVYPGNIEFSGTHTHDGTIVADTGAAIELNGGSNLLINGTLNGLTTGGTLTLASALTINSSGTLTINGTLSGTSTGGSLDLSATALTLDGLTVQNLIFADDHTTPGISQPQQAGTAGTDGYTLPVEAQQGQDGDGSAAGDGADLEFAAGLPGSGTPDGEMGRLIKKWGDSASFKWFEYEWCSGERAWSVTPDYPLEVPLVDNDVHMVEAFVLARRDTPTQYVVKHVRASFRRETGLVPEVSKLGEDTISSQGILSLTTTFNALTASWQFEVDAVAGTGDYVAFVRWRTVSLDGV